jgi:hypothetical protein
MIDPEKQAAFVAGLRKMADDAAAKNPTLTEVRKLAKSLVSETRARSARGQMRTPLGAYMGKEGDVSIVTSNAEDPNQATAEIRLKLKSHAEAGNIRAAALSDILDKQMPGGSMMKFIQVHVEHVTGKATVSAVPADEPALLAGVPGTDGPAVAVFDGPAKSKIFPGR